MGLLHAIGGATACHAATIQPPNAQYQCSKMRRGDVDTRRDLTRVPRPGTTHRQRFVTALKVRWMTPVEAARHTHRD